MASKQLQFLLMTVYILVTQMTNGAFGAITKDPLNLAVYEGTSNTTITCESDDPYLDWILYPFADTGSFGVIHLTTNGQLNPAFNELFAIDHPPGTQVHTLVVFNATIYPPDGSTFSTAGLYECNNNDFTGVDVTLEYVRSSLVVIRSDPVCSSNFTQSTEMLQCGDVIQLSCTIVYGSLRPIRGDAVMNWTVNGEPADNTNFTITSSPTEVTASSTLVIIDNFNATYECQTTFSPPQGEVFSYGRLATNTPDYFKTCSISLSDLPTISPCNPTTTTTSTTATTTATTTNTTPAHSTTTNTGLPPCYGILHLLSDLLRARCYTDWIVCSLEINILGIILFPDCRSHCKSQSYSSGTCISSSTSVGCPCIHPGNKKCICS